MGKSGKSLEKWEIKYENSEKSPSLIIERLVSMATKKIDWGDLDQKNLPGFSDLNTSTVKKSRRSDQYCGLYIVQIQKYRQTDRQTVVTNILCEKSQDFRKVTNRGDQYTLQKSTILQSNKPRWPIYFAKIYDFAK